jgi:hypothetical protein
MFQMNVLEQITSYRIALKGPASCADQRKRAWFGPVCWWEGEFPGEPAAGVDAAGSFLWVGEGNDSDKPGTLGS